MTNPELEALARDCDCWHCKTIRGCSAHEERDRLAGLVQEHEHDLKFLRTELDRACRILQVYQEALEHILKFYTTCDDEREYPMTPCNCTKCTAKQALKRGKELQGDEK